MVEWKLGSADRDLAPATDNYGSPPMIKRRIFGVAILATLVLALLAARTSRFLADDQPTPGDHSQLAKAMIGTWVLAGTPDNNEAPPAIGGRYKFFTGKYWTITEARPESGEVISNHG